MKNLKIIDESDFRLDEYKKIYGDNDERVYHDDLEFFKAGKYQLPVVVRDINKNGKLDIAFACSTPERDKAYLVIIEKDNKSFKFITALSFNLRLLLIVEQVPYRGVLSVKFLEGSYGKEIDWNGKEYVVMEDDPYGP